MPAKKPAGAYRIFLFGESAAQGDPDPSFGAGRYLQALLRERYPGMDFEVVCVAMTAINSHAILPIVRANERGAMGIYGLSTWATMKWSGLLAQAPRLARARRE